MIEPNTLEAIEPDVLGFNENLLTYDEKRCFEKRDTFSLFELICLSIGIHPDKFDSSDLLYQEHYNIRFEILETDIQYKRIKLHQQCFPFKNSLIKITNFCQYIFEEEWHMPKWFLNICMKQFWDVIQQVLSEESIHLVQGCAYLNSDNIRLSQMEKIYGLECFSHKEKEMTFPECVTQLRKARILFPMDLDYTVFRMNHHFQRFIRNEVEAYLSLNRDFLKQMELVVMGKKEISLPVIDDDNLI